MSTLFCSKKRVSKARASFPTISELSRAYQLWFWRGNPRLYLHSPTDGIPEWVSFFLQRWGTTPRVLPTNSETVSGFRAETRISCFDSDTHHSILTAFYVFSFVKVSLSIFILADEASFLSNALECCRNQRREKLNCNYLTNIRHRCDFTTFFAQLGID